MLEVLGELVYGGTTGKAGNNLTSQLQACPLANASVCGPSVAASRQGLPFTVVIYNPLAWPRIHGTRVPVSPPRDSLFTITGMPSH